MTTSVPTPTRTLLDEIPADRWVLVNDGPAARLLGRPRCTLTTWPGPYAGEVNVYRGDNPDELVRHAIAEAKAGR